MKEKIVEITTRRKTKKLNIFDNLPRKIINSKNTFFSVVAVSICRRDVMLVKDFSKALTTFAYN